MNEKEILKEFDDKYKDMYGGLFVFDANLRPIQDEVKQSLSDLINQAEKEIAIAYNEGYNKAVKKYVSEKKDIILELEKCIDFSCNSDGSFTPEKPFNSTRDVIIEVCRLITKLKGVN